MKFLIIQISFLFLGSLSIARPLSSFNHCSSTDAPRTELDHFCPRIEGIHLDGCCPPLFKNPPLNCSYAVLVTRGQAVLTQSSYNTCQGGVNVSVACCQVTQENCYKDKVDTTFIPRLLGRNKTCCFENCPTAAYWMTPPAKPGITAQHELVSGVNICSGSLKQACSVGSVANCQASDYCPTPPPVTVTTVPATGTIPPATSGPPSTSPTGPPATSGPPPTPPVDPGGA